ncbi:hypothetical protein SHJG_1868 [Streptomyces hygroscopicus subsp. jinggangensis 5008]|nr:hypothetical protein SHJG_1868 [Streptomyces hygroscopicus subsp. jinggangensis 5008]AGF61299.1 hypothetical protein SHJGH_1633 [Streptomyces hygroscopicus subsp. jinggangensis TL01]
MGRRTGGCGACHVSPGAVVSPCTGKGFPASLSEGASYEGDFLRCVRGVRG